MQGHFYAARVIACAVAALWAAGAAAQDDASLAEGKQIFTAGQPACQICHTLTDAGAAGAIGPNLDDLQPSEEQVRNVVRGGADGMPSYEERLSQDQIAAVARYVAQASRK